MQQSVHFSLFERLYLAINNVKALRSASEVTQIFSSDFSQI